MRIGIIAIQGNIEEHANAMLKALKHANRRAEIVKIKHRGIVPTCDALIIPGGESTTLGRLMEREGISSEIKEAAHAGIPIMGTCAGLVLLAKKGDRQVDMTGQPLLGLMDIHVNRNAFGRQRESFECPVDFRGLDSPFNAVFIRAPCITGCKEDVEVLSRYEGFIVAARQKNILALAFHPELTDDLRIHHYFLRMLDLTGTV
ncbi:MAG: pyridoxal 5'-phosphate synthase glutaminase subunit PdxT [Candidatus Methanoperedens sp.]|uniref:pyridoxal 5'-phosphate synthase glutaminase subunit PdxT n=1 Tax=Candidatus Methanoperedens nitratireducens TaxID=1392998 RepID=UPI00064F443F|nr:pyridoxal 5'-phosphate synthase glutaminase subunit PdxT [Candidatus Methanoperedens nitroreducens]MDJ1421270.1 pyridoxal 5'-phosphate synthase glutaminase subunit PdxT [Candidatus Methanoperedens sp.]